MFYDFFLNDIFYLHIYKTKKTDMGVPACCAAQSACYGLRFASVRCTMRACTHALRMPNAIKKMGFYEGGGEAPVMLSSFFETYFLKIRRE